MSQYTTNVNYKILLPDDTDIITFDFVRRCILIGYMEAFDAQITEESEKKIAELERAGLICKVGAGEYELTKKGVEHRRRRNSQGD